MPFIALPVYVYVVLRALFEFCCNRQTETSKSNHLLSELIP